MEWARSASTKRSACSTASGRSRNRVQVRRFPFGADHYLATGELMPKSVLEEYKQFDAILLGAIGDPRVETGLLERAIVGGIRWDMDQYINLRPIKLYAEYLTPIKDKTSRRHRHDLRA